MNRRPALAVVVLSVAAGGLWPAVVSAQMYTAHYVGVGREYAHSWNSPGGFVGISSAGTVCFTSAGWLPFQYSLPTGTLSPLPLSSKTYNGGNACGISRNGLFVAGGGVPLRGPLFLGGVWVWSKGGYQYQDLSSKNIDSSRALDTNDSGQVVGAAIWSNPNDNAIRAAAWQNGKPYPLPIPATGVVWSSALAINNQGRTVGKVVLGDYVCRAVLWSSPTASTYLDLGPGVATDISESNVVVGKLKDTDASRNDWAWGRHRREPQLPATALDCARVRGCPHLRQ